MATQYRISATAHAPARTMNNRKAAITEANNRARYAKYEREVTVTTVATGKLVHTVPAHTVPAAPTIRAEHTRKSIPTRLREAGIQWEQVHDDLGLMKYVIDGETMTPGQAVARYLA